MFWGDATLTRRPYGSAGTCIINYATPEINVVNMAKALLSTLYRNQGCVTIDRNVQFMSNLIKRLFIDVCFPQIRNNPCA